MIPKPTHLGPRYARQFQDASIASAYHTRLPYPRELFVILRQLMAATTPRVVLDLGCGTGDIALTLAALVDRIDAVDPSAAMLGVARARPGADNAAIRWIEASAETFQPDCRYAIVVAGESLHWMGWGEVFARMPSWLEPGAVLCIVSGREFDPQPWSPTLRHLLAEYSTNREYQPYDLVSELAGRGLFRERGRATTAAVACAQRSDDYVESFHTRNGFSRQRMTVAAAEAFDQALRRLVESYYPDGVVHGTTTTSVVWGEPLPPETNG